MATLKNIGVGMSQGEFATFKQTVEGLGPILINMKEPGPIAAGRLFVLGHLSGLEEYRKLYKGDGTGTTTETSPAPKGGK